MGGPSASDNYAGVYEGRLQPGTRPALLIVDVVMAYLTQGSALFMETAAGALASNVKLAEAARVAGVPVVFTNVRYKPDGLDGGVFYRKAPVLKAFVEGSPLGAFPDGLAPREGERVFTKQYPSAFFGTGLADVLHAADQWAAQPATVEEILEAQDWARARAGSAIDREVVGSR